MAGGRVIWSKNAQEDLKLILSFWKVHNGSNVYSRKLKKQFFYIARQLLIHPYLGNVLKEDPTLRRKLVMDYLLIYQIIDEGIFIVAIFDTQQDPDKLNSL